ncbi:hypothetical protein [Bradyrhizobium liaoningense]|uniref:hypothetical protein n=1 Tax=Bradyrhizobium liaoningense TaxID=43992 RepID=UPI001BA47EBA|nr:hypothetical protein [Bradyrhizobium liaoningense]MBR0945955.1 hypothetical protein [Bradyrhizobium liaoningense]
MSISDFYVAFRRKRGNTTNDQREVKAADLGVLAGAKILTISDSSLILDSEAHHGRILDFTSSSAVTVTVAPGLRPDFFCGISQGGAGQVTLSPAVGVSLVEQNIQFKTAQRYAMLSLIAFTLNSYRLFGNTAA